MEQVLLSLGRLRIGQEVHKKVDRTLVAKMKLTFQEKEQELSLYKGGQGFVVGIEERHYLVSPGLFQILLSGETSLQERRIFRNIKKEAIDRILYSDGLINVEIQQDLSN